MKYDNFQKLRKEFDEEFGEQLAVEYVCGKTGDARYCENLTGKGQYFAGECKLGHNPQNMIDWICPDHSIIPFTKIEEVKTPPNISKWFDIQDGLTLDEMEM